MIIFILCVNGKSVDFKLHIQMHLDQLNIAKFRTKFKRWQLLSNQYYPKIRIKPKLPHKFFHLCSKYVQKYILWFRKISMKFLHTRDSCLFLRSLRLSRHMDGWCSLLTCSNREVDVLGAGVGAPALDDDVPDDPDDDGVTTILDPVDTLYTLVAVTALVASSEHSDSLHSVELVPQSEPLPPTTLLLLVLLVGGDVEGWWQLL